jgi:mono/diheme cytochrome c family protein
MRRSRLILLFLAAASMAAVRAQDKPAEKPKDEPAPGTAHAESSGAYAFRTHCASCHGVDGKGDGPVTDSLRYRPPDLTLIAQRNGGRFPAEKVTRIVDGRNPVKGHGSAEMPIWGDAFRTAETGYDEATAKARVKAVVDHLKAIQAGAK